MTLYSIGHSNAAIQTFLDLLRSHCIQTVVDTRTHPYSRYSPQFNRKTLKRSLAEIGLDYVFVGEQLGGRPEGDEYYRRAGKPDYDLMAEASSYLSGIERLLELGARKRVAFMCSEADFRKCHRYWLITRTLVNRGFEVNHILHSGESVPSNKSEFEPAQLSLY
jgi:uncharacterized protein (DUF488 family)